MSNPEAIPEPSMEDILASIRQIISEGDEQAPAKAAPAKAAAPQRREEPREPEEDPYAAAAGQAEPEEPEEEDDVFDLTDEMVSGVEAQPAAAQSQPIPFPQSGSRSSNGVDPYAAALGALGGEVHDGDEAGDDGEASLGAEFNDVEFRAPGAGPDEDETAFATEPEQPLASEGEDPLLSAAAGQAVAEAFGRLTRRPSAGGDGRTIEELVVDMLRPMLKEWLDDNLPMLVERMVRDEIERVTRGRR